MGSGSLTTLRMSTSRRSSAPRRPPMRRRRSRRSRRRPGHHRLWMRALPRTVLGPSSRSPTTTWRLHVPRRRRVPQESQPSRRGRRLDIPRAAGWWSTGFESIRSMKGSGTSAASSSTAVLRPLGMSAFGSTSLTRRARRWPRRPSSCRQSSASGRPRLSPTTSRPRNSRRRRSGCSGRRHRRQHRRTKVRAIRALPRRSLREREIRRSRCRSAAIRG